MSFLVAEQREPRPRSVTVSEESLTVDLTDGRTIIVPLLWYPSLWHGKPAERNHFEIFGDGAYIHSLARFGRGLDGGWPPCRSPLRGESKVFKTMVETAWSKKT
jgi:Protein of unknown function (DUF2442)